VLFLEAFMLSFALRVTGMSALASVAACAAAPSDALESTVAVSTAGVIIVTGAASAPNGRLETRVSIGFEDSTFDHDTKGFCYVGKLVDVCGVISAYARKVEDAHSAGAHDRIVIESCTTTTATVGTAGRAIVKYHLSDDSGGSLDVERNIGECAVALGQSADPSATRIFRGLANWDVKAGRVSASAGVGFEDSTFDGDTKAFCYQGNVNEVCGLVSAYAAKMPQEDTSGAHATIDLANCSVADGKVSVQYNLSDDQGGDANETRVIEVCAGDQH
jgi:hypothetical protein